MGTDQKETEDKNKSAVREYTELILSATMIRYYRHIASLLNLLDSGSLRKDLSFYIQLTIILRQNPGLLQEHFPLYRSRTW